MTNYRTVFEKELSLLGRLYKKVLIRILFLCLAVGILLPALLLIFGQRQDLIQNLLFAIALNSVILIRFWIYPRLKWAKTQNHIVEKATIEDSGTIVLTTFSCRTCFRKYEPKQIVLHPHTGFVYDSEPLFLDRKWKHFPQSLDMLGGYSHDYGNERYYILLHFEMAVKGVKELTIQDAIISHAFSSN